MRIGSGYDVHQLVENRPLILGGVHIESEKGVLGSSDGDVLSHAIADSLLGAANLGDLGKYFPSNDPANENISSLIILERVQTLLRENEYRIENIDATIVLQKPKLAPHFASMADKISQALNIPVSALSIKATTTDHLGFTGRSEGIAALAVALIV